MTLAGGIGMFFLFGMFFFGGIMFGGGRSKGK
jgi:hypothetical protein